MTTPGTLRTSTSGKFFIVGSGFTLDKVTKTVTLQNERPDDIHWWVAAWNGHEFEVMAAKFYINTLSLSGSLNLEIPLTREYGAVIYYPIDPRMFVKDIAGATISYPNETNDGWLFAHCDNDYMRDRENLLVSALTDAFAPVHRQFTRETDYTAVHNLVDRFRENALERATIADEFHVAAELNLRKWARGLHIGWYHQNPHDAHINEPIEAAIKKTSAEWAADTREVAEPFLNKSDKLQKISTYIASVLARAAARHNYETRWDMEARIDAEKVASAAAGNDPVDGYEYCYAAVVANTPITGEDNLPDPTWAFDHLRNGPIDRGDYRYTDAQTPPNAFLFVSIRFKRPVPDGVVPGQDIGSVAWEQEPPLILSVKND